MKKITVAIDSSQQESGFTIVELLIASTLFSIILLVVISAITSFFNAYYKTLIATSTQNTIQSISDVVDHAIEYGPPSSYSSGTSTSAGTLTTGDTEFCFFIGDEEGTTPAEVPAGAYALYQQPTSTGSCPANPPAWTGGSSLLGTNYRLLKFNVTNDVPTSEWSIDIEIAYTSGGVNGDDLLCSTILPSSSAGGCGQSAAAIMPAQIADPTNAPIVCKSGIGSQFCEVDELQSIVENRESSGI